MRLSTDFKIGDGIEYILKVTPEAALLEQMSEECAELSQALLKKARKLRNENYTPMTLDEIQDNLIEEWNDILLCAMVLDLGVDVDRIQRKLNRWVERQSRYEN